MIPLGVFASARVAPAGGWTPASLPGLDLWLAADTLTGLSHGAGVPTWPDQSPAANHAAAAGSNITYQTNQINGRPAIQFGGTGWFTTTASASGADQTIIAVANAGNTGNRTILGPSVMGGLQLRRNANNQLQLLNAGTAAIGNTSTQPAINVWHLIVATYSDAADAWSIRVGKTPDGSGATAQTLTTGAAVSVGSHHQTNERWVGMVAEIIHCSALASAGDITAAESYLAAKYAL